MTPTLATDGNHYVLRFERILDHSPTAVWPALTTNEGLAAWFPARASFEARVGARMTFFFDDHDMDAPDGEVLEVVEPEVFAFAWGDDVLRFELAPEGAGTRLAFTHRFADRGMAARQAAGWEHCLDRLAGVEGESMATLLERYAVEFGQGRDGTAAELEDGRLRLRFERRLAHPRDRVWRALTEPGELAGWLAVAQLDLRPGGAVELRWQNAGRHIGRGTVTELDPPRLLAYELDVHGHVRWELLAEGDGCLLTLTVDAALGPDDAPKRLAGWHTHLGHLEALLGGAAVDWPRWDDEHRPAWQERHDRYAARLAAEPVA
ncbi:MAG TPA: SRPBCC domain-containing protein [Solirubrobacteraceae bacterium]